MAHYITVPINENGIVFDVGMNDVVAEAIAISPFGFADVYVYSHGWSNNAVAALDEYNRFSVEFAKRVVILGKQAPSIFLRPPLDSLGVGIHWPSQITEDPSSPLNALQLLTFYTMEHRADAVGKNAVYTMLRLMLQSRPAPDAPLRFNLLGHSFGCKVLCAALNDLAVDIAGGTIAAPPGTAFNVALLEPATDADNLDPGDIYGKVCSLAGSRLLISTSQCDSALTKWFVAAGALTNLLHHDASHRALGDVGPTANTIAAFGGVQTVSVTSGFTATALHGIDGRLVVADLTPVHTDRKNKGLYDGGIAGSHTDINIDEVYELVAGFFFGVQAIAA